MGIRRVWRWFRRRHTVVQAAALLLLAAAYSLALVALVSDDDDERRTAETTQQAPPRQMTGLERRVTSLVSAVRPKSGEAGDVRGFREPLQPAVRCARRSCEIRYVVGLPGRGRLLEDQRQLWERLFRETDVTRATVEVLRDHAAAGVPPRQDEETRSGQAIMTTTCDQAKSPNVDWAKRSGTQILERICVVSYDAGGRVGKQEPVAPDDPALSGDGAPGDEG